MGHDGLYSFTVLLSTQCAYIMHSLTKEPGRPVNPNSNGNELGTGTSSDGDGIAKAVKVMAAMIQQQKNMIAMMQQRTQILTSMMARLLMKTEPPPGNNVVRPPLNPLEIPLVILPWLMIDGFINDF